MRNKLCLTHSSREFSGTLHSLLYEERPDYANAIDNSHFLRLIGELDFVADQSGAVDEAGLRKHAPDIGEAKGEHGDITIITTEELQTTKRAFEPLIDIVTAAGLLKIHPKPLQRMARGGQIPAVRIGRYWRFRASQLDSW